MRVLYFDCFSGASGDMILGALIDAGVSLASLRSALGSLAIEADLVWTERVTRAGVSATKFCVRGEAGPDHAHDHRDGDDHEDGHSYDHHHHHHDPPDLLGEGRPTDPPRLTHSDEIRHHHHGPHRTIAEIHRLIDGSALSGTGKDRARDLFTRLGAAEAAVHGIPLDRVHLHEVGALDSIIDIVGAVHAMELIGADRVIASPLNVGSGTIRSAHGLYPVPAPATARLLEGAPIYSGHQAVELVTPTGALLITEYAESFGTVPPMRLEKVGYGAGARDLPDTPNVLRVLIGRDDQASSQAVVVIEAEIDDMNPQIFGVLMDRLLADGALDVFYTAIQMKKNRPGTLLSVVAAPDARERLTATIFRESTTIGVRYREMQREVLQREIVTVETPLGAVRMKIARRNGEMLNASPEFDDCVRIATAHGRPVKDVQALAMRAFADRQA